MGLACSQARLLTLTTRKADNELQTMLISNKKLALSREQSELSQEYYSKLQNKSLNYYDDGSYYPITYSYLMGDTNFEATTTYLNTGTKLDNATISTYKDDNSIILTDYRGLVVLNDNYAGAILTACGSNVSCDANGRGGTFSASYIPQIIAALFGYEEGDGNYEKFMAVYNNDTDAMEELGLIGEIDGTTEDGTTITSGFTLSSYGEMYQDIIDFYKPIFLACAENGWTSEYSSSLTDSDYINNALTSGIFELATVDDYGEYETGTSLEYYINAAFLTERSDSEAMEELAAWYNAEKEKISAKEDYWDIELQNLSTELSAIETEIESVESLIDDAISSVFDWGA